MAPPVAHLVVPFACPVLQVETLGAGQSRVLMDQTVRGMGQDPLMLLPARNMVPYLVAPGQTPEQAAAAALAAMSRWVVVGAGMGGSGWIGLEGMCAGD